MENALSWTKVLHRDKKQIKEYIIKEREAAQRERPAMLSEEDKENARRIILFPDNEPFSFIVHQKEERRAGAPLAWQPLISVIVPVYNVKDAFLSECIDSVLIQSYQNFELILVDDNSSMLSVKLLLHSYREHPKVHIIYRTENGGISRATNTGLYEAKGEFIAFCDCDDRLHPDALYECAAALNRNPGLDFIYTDEDKLTEDGRHFDPHYKPDWSPDMFFCQMYTCHLGVYRTSVVREAGFLRYEFDGSQDYEFTLRFLEHTEDHKICHIPKTLYHWRARRESAASGPEAKPYAIRAACRAREAAISRRKLCASLRFYPQASQCSIVYEAPGDAFVSVIIPSKDNFEYLKRCIDSVDRNTEFRNFEIIVVDNGSSDEAREKIRAFLSDYGARKVKENPAAGKKTDSIEDAVRYIYRPAEFNFSKMCNDGVSAARGNYLLLLNDDVVIPDGQGQWMSILLGHAAQSRTGGVGCMLLYPGMERIQHDGVISTVNGPSSVLVNHKIGPDIIYYFCRSLIEYNYAAVTGACLMIARNKYEEIGGMSEDLPVNYNDVDFGWRLYEKGYYNVVRNDVVLCHHEFVSRHNDTLDGEKMKKLIQSRDLLYERHPRYKDGNDPFYSKNFIEGSIDFSLPPDPFREDIETRLPDLPPFGTVIPSHLNFSRYKEASPWTRYNVEAVDIRDGLFFILGWVDDPELRDIELRGRILLEGDRGRRILIPFEWTERDDLYRKWKLSRRDTGFDLCCQDKWLNMQSEKYRICILLEAKEGGYRRILHTRYTVMDDDMQNGILHKSPADS